LGVNSGTGLVASPYNTANWALDTGSFPDAVASGDGDEITTIFGARYISNSTAVTDFGNYNAVITYTVTATF
jgi:type 1 fimbria pilin